MSPRPVRWQGGNVKARTSVLTGKVSVKVPPGTPQFVEDALWLHEQIHRIQRLRLGFCQFLLCRAQRLCTLGLEYEAYKAEIVFLGCLVGWDRISRENWEKRLKEEGYETDWIGGLLDDCFRQKELDVNPCLAAFLDSGLVVPCR